MTDSWSTDSWKQFPILQQPDYLYAPDGDRKSPSLSEEAAKVEKNLSGLPPLVLHNEILQLRSELEEVYEGKRFLIQGGDCAERFLDCQPDLIENKLKILLQMSLILTYETKMPTTRIGRIAGQYAKPRSKPTEVVDGCTVQSFRGDSVNSFDPDNRVHDPKRLEQSYFFSSATLNYIRSLCRSGFASLSNSSHWDLGYVNDPRQRKEYQEIVQKILDCLKFLETVGVHGDEALNTVDFFTSHEALVLMYESAMTRSIQGSMFDTSAHFIWIGNRTRQLDHAHVEFMRGIANPVGIKCGPSMTPKDLIALIKKVDPQNQPGKVVLISRFGVERVEAELPQLVTAVLDAKLKVVWSCDPMHGNTHISANGFKTRSFDDILKEIRLTFLIHQNHGSHLGGVHFELTGEDVTECIGGPQNLEEKDLHHRYTTYCDPRLNYAQSMEIAFLLARLLKGENQSDKINLE